MLAILPMIYMYTIQNLNYCKLIAAAFVCLSKRQLKGKVVLESKKSMMLHNRQESLTVCIDRVFTAFDTTSCPLRTLKCISNTCACLHPCWSKGLEVRLLLPAA